MFRNNLETNAGLVRFHSRDAVSAYLEALLEYYKSKHEEYGQQLGEHLRGTSEVREGAPKQEKADKKDKGGQKPTAKGWTRVGELPVNVSDPTGALAQVTLRIVEDYKAKVDRLTETLKSFKDIDSVSQGAGTSYTLYIMRGVPEGVIVEYTARRVEAFAFAASFRAV